jgi:hypothetical protein
LRIAKIVVTPSLGYDAAVQVLDAGFNPIACVNAGTAGIQESFNALALSSGTY